MAEPPYIRVMRSIRERIESGELRDGDHVPSARQIVRDWHVALATATKVLAALRSEGLVEGVPGVGTVVTRGLTGHSPAGRMAAIRRTGRIYPADERARITAAELVPAPRPVADALGLAESDQVIRRQRVTYRGEQPVSASTSWFDGALAQDAPALLRAERIPQGTPRYVEERTGRIMTSGHDQSGAAAADERVAADLGVPVGAPVLRGRTWVFDADGGVIEYGESVSVGGRWLSHDYQIAD